MEYGYARVSTVKKQDRQIESFKKLGVHKIYVEKCSGKILKEMYTNE